MELAHEYQNIYVRAIIQAFNEVVLRGSMQSYEFEELVYRYANDSRRRIGFDFIRAVINSPLFIRSDKNTIKPRIPVTIRFLPTSAELEWLVCALRSPISELFFDADEKSAMLRKLEQIHIPDMSSYMVSYGISCSNMPDRTVFRILMRAIQKRYFVVMTNHAANGLVYQNQVVIPFGIEYEAIADSWYLSFCRPDAKRPMKAALSRISDVRIGEQIPESQEYDLRHMMQDKKAVPIELYIYPERNTPERAIQLFSQYDMTVFPTKDSGIHMTIQYYVFDEERLFRQIVSFGPSIRIMSPAHMVDKMMDYLTHLPY